MKRLSVLALALLYLFAGGIGAPAQDKYPTKPIRILVPCSPGGPGST
jgi:tripartite-type tricarboxylate transporter receptor subunit TctC